jgi:hypothetical protein
VHYESAEVTGEHLIPPSECTLEEEEEKRKRKEPV